MTIITDAADAMKAHEDLLAEQLRQAKDRRHDLERQAKLELYALALKDFSPPEDIDGRNLHVGCHVALRRAEPVSNFFTISTVGVYIPLAFGWMTSLGSSGLGSGTQILALKDGMLCTFYMGWEADKLNPVFHSKGLVLPNSFTLTGREGMRSWHPSIQTFDEVFSKKGIDWRAAGWSDVEYERLFQDLAR